jgi:hypothetical protein
MEQSAIIREKMNNQSRVSRKMKFTSVTATAVAVCIMLSAAVFALPMLRTADANDHGAIDDYTIIAPGTPQGNDAIQGTPPATGEIEYQRYFANFFFVANGEIQTERVIVRHEPTSVFEMWAQLNGVANVTVVNSSFEGVGIITTDHGDGIISQTPASSFVFTLTLSAEFAAYAENTLLTESLEMTFNAFYGGERRPVEVVIVIA